MTEAYDEMRWDERAVLLSSTDGECHYMQQDGSDRLQQQTVLLNDSGVA